MLPITQVQAGWFLVLAALGAFAVGFALRSLLGGRRKTPAVRGAVRWVQSISLVRILVPPPTEEEVTDDELDHLVLVPALTAGTLALLGGTFLLGLDSFRIQLILFRLP